MHRLTSTAVPPPPAPPVEPDPYTEGYAEGYAAALRERTVLRVRALVGVPVPDQTADRAQIAALGQRGDQGV